MGYVLTGKWHNSVTCPYGMTSCATLSFRHEVCLPVTNWSGCRGLTKMSSQAYTTP